MAGARGASSRVWAASLLLLAVILTLTGTAGNASAAVGSTNENRVKALHAAVVTRVGPAGDVGAGQRWGEAAPLLRLAEGRGVHTYYVLASSPGGTATGDAVLVHNCDVPGFSISEKIAGQMGPRGWSHELLQETIDNPAATHSVWDFTGGTRQAATAYARSDGSYVVLNDETRAIVQVSDINKVGWKPVWDDPRFQR